MAEKVFLSIVIPCLNERETILKVIQDAHDHAKSLLSGKYEIIVSDNGSTDGTLDLLNQTKTPIRIIHVPVRGYGAALHWGIMSAQGEYVLFGDADMSYPFSNLHALIQGLNTNPDLLLGSRLKGKIDKKAMPFLNRHLGTPVLTKLIRWIYHIPTSDCNSGMRIIRRSFYAKLKMRNPGMEWASELLIKTALKEGKYSETPIHFKKDQRNRPPHLSRWQDGWRHLKSIILYKPQVLYPLFILLPSFAAFFYRFDFSFTFLFLLLTFVLGMGLISIQLLYSSLESEGSWGAKLLNRFSTVQFILFLELCLFISLFFIPKYHMGAKLMVSSIMSVVLIWFLFNESLKTFIVNRLPENLER